MKSNWLSNKYINAKWPVHAYRSRTACVRAFSSENRKRDDKILIHVRFDQLMHFYLRFGIYVSMLFWCTFSFNFSGTRRSLETKYITHSHSLSVYQVQHTYIGRALWFFFHKYLFSDFFRRFIGLLWDPADRWSRSNIGGAWRGR